MISAIKNIYIWYIFINKWYSNDFIFYICDVEGLFKRFAHEFFLFHCSSGNNEKLDFSIIR